MLNRNSVTKKKQKYFEENISQMRTSVDLELQLAQTGIFCCFHLLFSLEVYQLDESTESLKFMEVNR